MSLRRSATTSALWTWTGSAAALVRAFFGLAITSRLLGPQDLGQWTTAFTLSALVGVFGSSVACQGALQHRDPADINWRPYTTLAKKCDWCIAVLLVVISGWNSLASKDESAQTQSQLIALIALSRLVEPWATVASLHLQANHRWARYHSLKFTGETLALAATIAAALAGLGPHSYALGVAAQPITLAIAYRSSIRKNVNVNRHDGTSPKSAVDYKAFARHRIYANVIAQGSGHARARLLNSQSGAASLGNYTRGLSLVELICSQTSTAVMAAMYPVLTRLEPGSRTFLRASRSLLLASAMATTTALAPLILAPRESVSLLLGAKWSDTVPFLPWLALAGIVSAADLALRTLLLANQNSRARLKLDIAAYGSLPITLAVIPLYGIEPFIKVNLAVRATVALYSYREAIAKEAIPAGTVWAYFKATGLTLGPALAICPLIGQYLLEAKGATYLASCMGAYSIITLCMLRTLLLSEAQAAWSMTRDMAPEKLANLIDAALAMKGTQIEPA